MWNDHLFFVRKSIIVVSGRRCSDQALFVLQHVHVRSFHFSAIILIDNIEFFENIEFQFWYFYIFDYIYDSNSFYKIKISEIIEILIVRFWEVIKKNWIRNQIFYLQKLKFNNHLNLYIISIMFLYIFRL